MCPAAEAINDARPMISTVNDLNETTADMLEQIDL